MLKYIMQISFLMQANSASFLQTIKQMSFVYVEQTEKTTGMLIIC